MVKMSLLRDEEELTKQKDQIKKKRKEEGNLIFHIMKIGGTFRRMDLKV